MKSYLILLLFYLVSSLFDVERHEKIVNIVNNKKTTWKAEVYHRDIIRLLGVLKETPETKLPEKTTFKTADSELPESFDLREAYPQCETIREIRDDSGCGSSPAFAAVETMSDRLCIHSNGKLQTRLSSTDVITCCTSCGYCFGGYPSAPFTYWINNGIPSGGLYGDKTTCKPDFQPPYNDYENIPECETKCQEGYPKTLEEDKTYGINSYSIRGETNIMKEIYENGSVLGTFTVYEDFGDYTSGVYQHITGAYLGTKVIKIIGWGVTEDGIKYWIIANSWNVRWGEKGFFRMLRGNNECGIEESAITGMPKI